VRGLSAEQTGGGVSMYYDITFRKTEQSKDVDYIRRPDWNSAMEWLKENGERMFSILIFKLEGEMPCQGGRTHG